MRSLLVVLGSFVFLLVAPLSATDPVQVFADEWKGTTVILKKPLYTFAWGYAEALLGYYSQGQLGVTWIAPAKGIYYRCTAATPVAHVLEDTDVERLAQRARADAAYGSSAYPRRSGQAGSAGRTTPYFRLVTHAAGTKLVVKRVLWDRGDESILRIELTRPSAPTGQPVTHLVVEWPGWLSAQFVERPKVEALMAEFFERVK